MAPGERIEGTHIPHAGLGRPWPGDIRAQRRVIPERRTAMAAATAECGMGGTHGEILTLIFAAQRIEGIRDTVVLAVAVIRGPGRVVAIRDTPLVNVGTEETRGLKDGRIQFRMRNPGFTRQGHQEEAT